MRTRDTVVSCNRHMELISQLADDARYHPRSSARTVDIYERINEADQANYQRVFCNFELI